MGSLLIRQKDDASSPEFWLSIARFRIGGRAIRRNWAIATIRVEDESSRRCANTKRKSTAESGCATKPSYGLFAWGRDWLAVRQLTFSCYRGDDLAAVEAAIFYEDFGSLQAAHHHSGQINSWDVAFEGFGI